MRKILFFVLTACLTFVAGCATQWHHDGHNSQARFQQDQAECQHESLKYGQASGYYETGIGAGIADGIRQGQIFNSCMRTRGYYTK